MRNNKNKKIFTPKITRQALDIMKKISSRPCAKPFINFFPNVDKNMFQAEPICLSLITNKLKNHRYKTPVDWYHDMKLINTNCSLIFHDNQNLINLSNQLFIRFEKEFDLFVSYSQSKWTKLVGMLSHQLIFKMLKQPPKNILISSEINAVLLQNYPFIMDYTVLPSQPNEKGKNKPIQNNFSNIFSDSDDIGNGLIEFMSKEEKENHEQNCFLSAVSALKSRDDAKNIVEIIAEEQPKINIEEPNPTIDFSELEKPTIRRLIEYTKKRYIELGLNYPK